MEKTQRILLFLGTAFLTFMSTMVICDQANAIQFDNEYFKADTGYWQESYKERLKEWDKAPASNPCVNKGTSIVVHTYMHRLFLCEKNKLVSRHNVAIGRGGIDKRKEGDLKTPIGTYSLGLPRMSNDFYLFISVGYPTAEQRKLGYTGGAIGIHGPYFRFLQLWGAFNTLVDWTQGCIAVGTDAEIDQISSWLARFPNAVINIFDERTKK